MSYETAVQQWRAGERRIDAVEGRDHRILDRVIDAVVAELRRRLGGTFTADELADLYDAGTSWCLDLAVALAPEEPRAWESDLADAAFARYLRQATDYAGGRRLA